ncbi:hypothetical protein Tco_1017077 [Tanacetum coccineum]|uniref:Copia protein n=1 Tax=Tanacetum coccineum TaxID=301880 RepID=A0ABQ5FQH1_9ASTR
MEDKIFFNQSKYIKEMLKKFGLEDSKPTKTPMSTEIKLTNDNEADSVDSSKYQGIDETTYLEVVKHIFRYIRGTIHLGIWYPKGTEIETVVYADSDHEGDYVDRKSTSGICTFMGCCLTSWFAKKQMALPISTTKAEYVSAGKACQQALWMKQALIDYGIHLDDVPIILIAVSNSGRGQAPEKVTATYLFYLRSIDEGMVVNVPYLLAQYLFRHVEGRKYRARLSGGHFVRCLTEYFGLVTKEGLRGLTMVVWVAPGPERPEAVAAGAPEIVEGAHADVEGDQAVSAPV